MGDSQQIKIQRVYAVTSARDGNPALTRLAHLLTDANISLEVKDTIEDAAAAMLMGDEIPDTCVMIDAVGGQSFAHIIQTVPHATPIVFANGATTAQVIEALRGGAFEFVDFSTDSEAGVLEALERALVESRNRLSRRKRVSSMRAVVEDFLRVLVKAERRSIDLEEKLRHQSAEFKVSDELANEPDPDRPPCVLVVDDDPDVVDLLEDVLSQDGLLVKSALLGEQAIEQVGASINSNSPIDLLLIDKNLPDVDGIRVIGRTRDLDPTLAAMMMTGFASTESAIDAADLGVVGYVLKPFDDVALLARRVREVASRAMLERRERRYLERIKNRHSEFLLRYRQLAAQFDKLT